MPSLLPGFEYDTFISYRQKDNRQDGWVTAFVHALRKELDATFKEEVSIYFDENPHDGLLATHDVEDSLRSKLKCLIFIPIISQTYCDPNSFAWTNELLVFKELAVGDQYGLKIKLPGGNVGSRILPIRIHDLDTDDKQLVEAVLGPLRSVEFIYKTPGVNRPLAQKDDEIASAGQVRYRNQINMVANSVKELVIGLKNFGKEFPKAEKSVPSQTRPASTISFWQQLKDRNVFKVAVVYGIVSWVVIQIAATIFPPLHIPDWVLTAMIVVVLLGFPIALILAWAFENGHKRNDLQHAHDPESGSGARRNMVLIASSVAILAIALYFIGLRYAPSKVPASHPGKSIAVLPFVNMTGDKDLEYFSDGMMLEVYNHLAKIADLHVAGMSSALSYKDSKLAIPEIATKLGVMNVLQGIVRKSGRKIRITVQLIDDTDKQIWARDYDYRELKDIFTVQTELSTEIVKVLQASLTALETGTLSKKNTENPEAYRYYLKGRFYWDKRTRIGFDSAEANYRRAIDLDPQYALPYSGLADCYIFNQKGISQTDAIPLAGEYAKKALSLDSTLCEARTTIAFIQSHFYHDWNGAKRLFKSIISDNENYPFAHLFYGNVLLFSGQEKEGIAETKKALGLDPLSSQINMVLGRNYFLTSQTDLAAAQLQKTITLNPKFMSSYGWLGYTYLQKKMYKEALETFDKLPAAPFDINTSTNTRTLYRVYALALSGNKVAARAEFEKVTKADPKDHYPLAVALIGLGNYNEALGQLEQCYNANGIELVFFKINPVLDPVRNEPRFQAILKKLNLN